MATRRPLFNAVTSSARQILLLLRCIAFSKKAVLRIAEDGIRFSAEEGSVMEASVFLEKALFTSYRYSPRQTNSDDEQPELPIFEINMILLLETLNIFSVSDTSVSRRDGEYDAFAAHRLHRHAGINSFANRSLGPGTCTLAYDGEGSALSIHISEGGVTTTCDLTTYEANTIEEIPFRRENIALKTIMRSTYLLDAMSELNSMSPSSITIQASPSARSGSNLSLTASGVLGSASVDFTLEADTDTAILETFQCPEKTSASFKFSCIKAAQRAMASANKVSLRLDEEGVLSMQYLIEVDAGSAGEGVAFVDFRVVPLVEGEGDEDDTASTGSSDY